jgi:hypothetical protein
VQTLSYGFKKPDAGDRGPTVFPALESDIQQLNDHTHNGANSAKLPGSSIESGVVVVPQGSWIADVGGMYKQTVSVPAAFDLAKAQLSFRVNNAAVFPKVTILTATQFEVFSNDNTVSFTALVG